MYLKQLYKHNKWLTALVILFIAGQLFVILIWGIVVSPFYNYGMYSQVMKPQKEYWAFEVNVNGQNLHGKDFSAQQWDKILLPLNHYGAIKTGSNQLLDTDVQRIMGKLKLHPDEARFLQNCNPQRFMEWYKKYLSVALNQTVDNVSVHYKKYELQNQRLQATPVAYSISQLCH